MIAPIAITLALAFWAPYNGGPLPCTAADVQTYHYTGVDAGHAALGNGCTISIAADYIDGMTIKQQCGILAHEWGHAWFGLPHSDDPHNVMDPLAPPPGACEPPTPTTINASHRRTHAPSATGHRTPHHARDRR